MKYRTILNSFAMAFRIANTIFNKVDAGVTDELRRVLEVPSLAEMKAREARMKKKK